MPNLSINIRRKPTLQAREAGTVYTKPAYSIKPAMIVRGKLRKCLVCGGIPRINFNQGTVTGFQPNNKPYQHLEDCRQKGKF